MINRFDSSPSKLVAAAYPSFHFLPWSFTVAPHNWWKDVKLQRLLFYFMVEKFEITEPSDWYRVSEKQLTAANVDNAINRLGGLQAFLPQFYPSVEFDSTFFERRRRRPKTVNSDA